MLLTTLIIVAALVVVFLIGVAFRQADFRVTRHGSVSAPPAAVFPHVNDLRKWQAWSPWARRDPAAKSTFEGPLAGAGAIFRWAGNKEVGEGSMTIIESRPNEVVRFKLEFLKPFACSNRAEFTFKPDGNRTVITWTMYGKHGFLAKAIAVFMDMDKMIGRDFESGLANLKQVVESSAGD